MKNKSIKIILVLLVFFLGLPACKTKKKDNTLTSLLLLSALTGSSTGPKYEFSETTTTATTLVGANALGAGIPGYAPSVVAFASVGTTNPSAIVQVEQEHSVGGAGIDFIQYFGDNGDYFYSRNGVGVRIGNILHWYGRDTTTYTARLSDSNPVLTFPAVNYSANFFPVVPSNTLPVIIRKVRSLIPATAEENSFTPDSSTSDHSQRGMSKVWSTEKKINVHLIFVSGSNPAASEAGIATAINRMTTLYSQNSVRIRPVITSTTLSDSAYLNLTSLDGDSVAAGSLGGLFANNGSVEKADSLNIFFVKSENAVGGVLGVAGGIPGLPGKVGTRSSAMVVMFDSHLATPGATPTDAELTLMGETMAHEGGHWLGLFHLVESNYDTTQNTYNRDPISETPRCIQASITLAGCDGTAENNSGARNVMFWSGDIGFEKSGFTGEQGWVLRRHPLVY
ncbi:MAG: hypothetical protein KBA66_04460 [Leptospiraceae bacterium]|nr:hypothetical protein [Leptospiraceae bacterium]